MDKNQILNFSCNLLKYFGTILATQVFPCEQLEGIKKVVVDQKQIFFNTLSCCLHVWLFYAEEECFQKRKEEKPKSCYQKKDKN